MAGRWGRSLRGGEFDLTQDGPPGGEGPGLQAGPRDLNVAEARVEIRALWARVRELELELQQMRRLWAAALFQIQIHG